MSRKQFLIRLALCAAVVLFIFAPLFSAFSTRSDVARAILVCAAAALAGYLVFTYYRTAKMRALLGASSEEEFEELKRSCSFNHKNKLFISDEWVINVYSLKAYRLRDIVDVETRDAFAPRSGTRYYVKVRLFDGRDNFKIGSRIERDRVASALRDYYAHDGKPIVSDDAMAMLKKYGAGTELNEALRNLGDKNKNEL